MRILVATWGNPERWQEVNYYFLTDSEDNYSKSKTTYVPIFEIEKPDRGIIIVQNSLFVEYNVFDENLLKEKIFQKLKEFGANENIINNTEVIVTISSGKYKKGNNFFSFRASFYDILLNIFIQLYPKVKDAKEVILDLTHGINYLPTATFLALSYLKKIYNFRIRIYNSTPIDMKENILDSFILKLGESQIEGKLEISLEELNNIFKNLKMNHDKSGISAEVIKKAYMILVSYKYGLIFPLVYYTRNFQINSNYILDLFIPRQVMKDNSYVVNKSNEISVSSEEIFKFIFSILFAENIAKKFKKISTNITSDRIILDLNSIKNIYNDIADEVAKKLIENELSALEFIYQKKDEIFENRDEILYKDADRKAREKFENEYNRRSSNESRNFFAHVSLLQNYIYLKRNEILEYKFNSEIKGKIKKFIREIKKVEL